jgi:hypothetical protein
MFLQVFLSFLSLRKCEEDTNDSGEQVADDAETEERLVRGDVVGRRGRVFTHKQSARNIDAAEDGDAKEQEVGITLGNRWVRVIHAETVGKNSTVQYCLIPSDQVPRLRQEQRTRIAGTCAADGENNAGVRVQPDCLQADVKIEAIPGIGVCIR